MMTKFCTILSLFAFLFFFEVGTADAQSAANSPARAQQFELAAKATDFSRAYQFTLATQNPEGLAQVCQNFTGIDVVFCTNKFKGAQPGTYRFLVNTEGDQYGIPHIKNMLQQQGYPNVEVEKMKQ